MADLTRSGLLRAVAAKPVHAHGLITLNANPALVRAAGDDGSDG